jgi:starch synthase
MNHVLTYAPDPGSASGSSPRLKILLAAAEVIPFAKTGGLGEVCGSLPQALARRGHDVAVVMPLFHSCRQAKVPIEPTPDTVEVAMPFGSQYGRVWKAALPHSSVPIYFIEHNLYFDRDYPPHTIYQYKGTDGHHRDYEDNLARFAFFSRAALNLCHVLNWRPDIVHCNDWHTALMPVYLKTLYRHDPRFAQTRSLLTIHNQAYQGIFSKEQLWLTGLGWDLFTYHLLEFRDAVNLLKGGIVFADAVNAVSRRYAEEIQTYEGGFGLADVVWQHRHKVTGIMNGVDYNVWNPAIDQHLPMRYGPENVSWGKAVCKARLQERAGLPRRADVPLIGMVTRLVAQKGIDLLEGAAWDLLNEDVQLAVLGTGEPRYESFLRLLARTFPHKTAIALEFNEHLAHQIVAASDMYLMPSEYEPSGLNQLYSLKYGAVPVVRETGGLADSVVDCSAASLATGAATGFLFADYHPKAMLWALHRALGCFRDNPEVWHQLQQNGMRQDWSWDRGAGEYERLYRKMLPSA